MKWSHKVDPTWLKERKKYLTASDVKKLIPVTATGRPRYNIEEAYLKVWAEKQCLVDEEDVYSQGVMARGHLMEPYAITEFNKLGVIPVLHHWDDLLVYSKDGASCSPDALDVAMPTNGSVELEEVEAFAMGEVKAYSPGYHYAIGMEKNKLTLEERWQIATAFYTMPTIRYGALILFNPSARHPLFYHLYTPAELKAELDMIEQVVNDYHDFAKKFDSDADGKCVLAEPCITEADIIAEVVEKMDLNAGLNP